MPRPRGRSRPSPAAASSSAARTARSTRSSAATGCIFWTFSAAGGVRTAITIGTTGGRTVVYFADTAANAYALDAETGRTIWTRKVDDHPLARITGSPTLFEGSALRRRIVVRRVARRRSELRLLHVPRQPQRARREDGGGHLEDLHGRRQARAAWTRVRPASRSSARLARPSGRRRPSTRSVD